jgi:acyl-CoA hydrolase
MKGKKVKDSQVVMTQLVLPTHTNSFGTIFGGTIMSWIDIAGAIAAQRHSNSEVVTASVDDLHFIAPVYKGWVVNLKASVNWVGRSSMEVGVRVDSENPRTGETFHTSSAYLTFVALGSNGKPKEIPGLELETTEEKQRFQDAIARRELRLKRRNIQPKHEKS